MKKINITSFVPMFPKFLLSHKFKIHNSTFNILFPLFLFPFYFLRTAQTVYEPIHSGVYDFLDLMAQKGIIQFHDNIKPVSREYIAEKLQQLSINTPRK